MPVHHARNERIKRQYFAFLKEAQRRSESTIDGVAKALDRFEVFTGHRDFEKFHVEQAIAFKRHLGEQENQRSLEKLSKATIHSTLLHLKRFFQWLSRETGYKSRVKYSDAEYFNPSEKDSRVATARRDQPAPTMEQIKHVLDSMPRSTEIENRNRALIAFALLTGARDGAITSMKLKHVDLHTCSVYQDARDVKTKFSKTFKTYFFPVGKEILQIFVEWVTYLRETKLLGNDDPLFPATATVVGKTGQFEVLGLKREHWRNASPIRVIFRDAFVASGLPYFNPHSLRRTLVQLGQKVCKTPEQFKAWSQNLGHESPLTTFLSYGEVEGRRQGEIIQELAKPQKQTEPDVDQFADAVVKKLRASASAAALFTTHR